MHERLWKLKMLRYSGWSVPQTLENPSPAHTHYQDRPRLDGTLATAQSMLRELQLCSCIPMIKDLEVSLVVIIQSPIPSNFLVDACQNPTAGF
jgi:hypothetical protein